MRNTKVAARRNRAAKTRARIALSGRNRLSAHRTSQHIYVQLLSPDCRVLASASSVEKDIRATDLGPGIKLAEAIGQLIAKKVKAAGLPTAVAFDRGGFSYAGRIRALADGARSGGLQF